MYLKYIDKNVVKDFIKENICCCVDDPAESIKTTGAMELIFNCGLNGDGEHRVVHCFCDELFLVNFNCNDNKINELNKLYRAKIVEHLPETLVKKYLIRIANKKSYNQI